MAVGTWLPDRNVLKKMTAGGIAGAVSRTLTSPIERYKCLKQMDVSNKYTGVFPGMRKIYVEEGLYGFMRGNGANVVRIAPNSAIQFLAFDFYKKQFDCDKTSGEIPVWRTLASGACTGMTSSTAVYPLDMIRSRLSVQGSDLSALKYRGIGHGLRTVFQEEGIRGLYKGWFATLGGIAPYIAINFTTFDVLKKTIKPHKDDPMFDLLNLSLGATSGGIAATLTYPTDVVRRRMQCVGMAGFPVYESIGDCCSTMVRQEGVSSLYKGMVPCWLKVMPSMAISFMTFERVKILLELN